ncbi:MAG: DUF87 domain-containing protein, partial [Thermoplasmata archaeon]|nr:DUF87 domain-containing protein [Thermoplasmata archaeon]
PTRSRAERMRAELLGRLRSFGFRPRVPVYETAEVLAPPDPSGRVRRPAGFWHTLPTDGVAAFFPFVDESVVEEGGVLVGLLLDDASPVLLDRWRHASHSWGIFGATGSGKSFAASLLAVRSRWARPEVELYLLDPLGEFSRLSEILGGQTVRIAGGAGGRVNPLDGGPFEKDLAEGAAGFGAALRTLFPSLTDPESSALDVAITELRRSEGPPPTLSDLIAAVRGARPLPERLLGLLEVFRSGSLRHLDGPTTLDWNRTPLAFDLTGVSEAHLPFHLTYLLDVLYARLRSSPNPKLVVVDEAHLLARHPATAEFLDRLVRHVRHFRTGLLLVSQNPDDFLGSESGRSLLRNLQATLLLRLPEVSDAARRFFGLTDAEAEWLPRSRLPKEAGYSEGLLRLGPSHLPVAVVASTPEYELLTSALRGPEADGLRSTPMGPTTPTASL